MPSLGRLFVRNSQVTTLALHTLLCASASTLPCLSVVSFTEMQNHGEVHLPLRMCAAASVRALDFGTARLGDDWVDAFVSVGPWRRLEALVLYRNHITDAGAARLTRKALPALEHLDLRRNLMSEDGAERLAAGLKRCTVRSEGNAPRRGAARAPDAPPSPAVPPSPDGVEDADEGGIVAKIFCRDFQS